MGVGSRIKAFFTRSRPVAATQEKTEAYVPGHTHYNGAYGSGSGGAKWPYGLSADGRIRHIDHYSTRQNVRDQIHESLDARAVVERFADSVVDTGLILESVPDTETLGISTEQAETWAKNVERRFHLWANDKKQHRAGNVNFYQAQRMYMFMQQRDNDVFSRLFYSGRPNLQNPLQYDFIDANQIRGYAWTSTYAQTGSHDGIEKNPDGTEKAYKIWVTDPAKPGAYKPVTIPRIGPRSKKVMMLHGFTAEYAGQYRGFPRLAVAIQDLENLTDFNASAIKKAINQSNMVFSVENQQQDPGNPFEGITSEDRMRTLGVTEETTEIVNQIAPPAVCPIPEAAIDTPGGLSFVSNEQGDIIKLLDTKAPADNFREFVLTFSERLAAALSIPIEVVLMKFGQNYSASRATLLLFWRVVQIWRAEMAADFLNPIFEAWLSEEIAAGRVSAPGFTDPRLRAAWLSCQWIGSPLPSIDPGKEAKARKDNLEMNLTTLEREARNLNGSDANANIARNQKTFPTLAAPYWTGNGQNPEPDEEEEDDG